MVEEEWHRSEFGSSRAMVEVASAAKSIACCRFKTAKRTQLGRYFSMTSWLQFQANRRNALKSTGPNTEAGKEVSRRNAVRHGLTAETVIGALEDAEDYKAFEKAIAADYDAQSAVERELVLRLASLLWRLRRATMMETGLFELDAEHLRPHRKNPELLQGSSECIHELFRGDNRETKADAPTNFARSFLRLANMPNFALDRLNRYEATLCRQAGRIIYALETLDRRKPQERTRRLWLNGENQIDRE